MQSEIKKLKVDNIIRGTCSNYVTKCKLCGRNTDKAIRFKDESISNIEYCIDCQIENREGLIMFEKYKHKTDEELTKLENANRKYQKYNNAKSFDALLEKKDNPVLKKLYKDIRENRSDKFLINCSNDQKELIKSAIINRYFNYSFIHDCKYEELEEKKRLYDILILDNIHRHHLESIVNLLLQRKFNISKLFLFSSDENMFFEHSYNFMEA